MKTRLSLITLILVSSTLFFSGQASLQTKRGLLPTDLSTIKEVSDAQISPDGSRVVYVVSEVAPDRSRMISRLWIVPTAGSEPKLLTKNDASETTPRWSPDGKWIAFYSSRDKKDGLWIVSADGGEPKLATYVVRTNFYLNKAGESFTWSPDSKQIAFLSSPEVLSQSTPGENTAALQQAGIPAQVLRPLSRDEIEKLPVEVREMIFRAQGQAMGVRPTSPVENALSALPEDPRVITRLQYKSRIAFSDSLQSHIFTVDLATKQLRQITTGLYYEHSINWSPKGDEIVFVSNHEPDPDRVNNSDLFTVNVGNFAIRQLTKTKGCEWQPVFSPDGSQIAYLGTKREITTIDSVAEDTHLFLLSYPQGEVKDISVPIDRRVAMFRWGKIGEIGFAVLDRGKTVIYAFAGGKLNKVFDTEKQINSFGIQSAQWFLLKDRWFYTASDVTHPIEIYSRQGKIAQGSDQVIIETEQLTSINDQLYSSISFSTQRELTFQNDNAEIQGWLISPSKLDEKKKYPVILSIHGGPHGMHGYSFNANAQALAAQGYAVLLINPRGSSGYGQKFADGSINDWGGGDYRDLMKGVDVALEKFPFLDKDRMGVMGGSYGGYMTNWIVTQTDRFKAAVTSASLSNLISFYSTSLYQDLIHAEFGGMPWDNFDLLWDRSPLKHIKKAKTPLLLIHGEQDNDVHITQAEEMYTALKMRGVDAVLVRYPREGHGFREPRHREDSLARTIQWFDRYLKK